MTSWLPRSIRYSNSSLVRKALGFTNGSVLSASRRNRYSPTARLPQKNTSSKTIHNHIGKKRSISFYFLKLSPVTTPACVMMTMKIEMDWCLFFA